MMTTREQLEARLAEAERARKAAAFEVRRIAALMRKLDRAEAAAREGLEPAKAGEAEMPESQ